MLVRKSFYEIDNFSETELTEIEQELEQNVLPFFENFLIHNKCYWDEFINIDRESLNIYENEEIFRFALMEIKYRNNYANAEELLSYIMEKRKHDMNKREKRLFNALKLEDEKQKKCSIDEIIKEVETNFLLNNRKLKKI